VAGGGENDGGTDVEGAAEGDMEAAGSVVEDVVDSGMEEAVDGDVEDDAFGDGNADERDDSSEVLEEVMEDTVNAVGVTPQSVGVTPQLPLTRQRYAAEASPAATSSRGGVGMRRPAPNGGEVSSTRRREITASSSRRVPGVISGVRTRSAGVTDEGVENGVMGVADGVVASGVTGVASGVNGMADATETE